MKKAICTLLVIFLFTLVFTQTSGYKISVSLEGYIDTLAYLGHYYGDKLSVSDTAAATEGQIIFEGDEPLKQGVYFLVSADRKKLFEFLVDEQQVFSLSTRVNGAPADMIIEGSDENTIFYNYLNNNKNSYDQMKALQEELKSLPEGNDSIVLIRDQIDSINSESIDYKIRLMADHPDGLTTLLFTVMREPEVPDFFLEDGRQDTLNSYLYYRKHYWDGIDFSDERILRTPVFYRKLDRYMNRIIPKHPDSVITEIDNMIAQTKENSEMKEYLLWYFTNTYETSKVMGYDRIFVHMVDEYFTNESYEWLNPTVQQNMINRVNSLRNVLLGEYAPALIMADTNNEFIAMHQVEAEYLIILFWTSTCGECKREVNILKQFYNETDLDLKIYAVNSDTTLSKWKDYIIKKDIDWVNVNGNLSLTGDYHDSYDIYSTPVIYVLDKKKKIIAKRLAAAKIPDFLSRHKNNRYE